MLLSCCFPFAEPVPQKIALTPASGSCRYALPAAAVTRFVRWVVYKATTLQAAIDGNASGLKAGCVEFCRPQVKNMTDTAVTHSVAAAL